MRFTTVICTLTALVVFAAASAFAGGAGSSLVDVLHNKGVIDDATYSQLSAQAAAAPAAPAAPATPQASAAPAERPLEKVLASIEEGFAKAGGDTVKIKLGTWLQGGFLSDDNGSNTGSIPGLVAVNPNSGNQFYTRFARIYFNAGLDNKVGMRITLDGASSQVLQDAYLFTDYIPYTRITMGQYLIPFGDEYWRAPFDVPMINYALASTMVFVNQNENGKATNYVRDIGIMANVKYGTKIGGLPFGASLQTTVINGAGRNTTDVNDSKDWVGRMTINPFLPGLSVGGSWYIGKADVPDSAFVTGSKNTRIVHHQDIQRWGAEFDYAPPYAKGLALRGEYLYQRQFFTGGFTATVDHSQAPNSYAFAAVNAASPVRAKYFQSAGWYVTGLYRVNGLGGIARYLNDFEPTFRYEELNEDLSVSDKNRSRTTVGLNYWLNRYTRLLANYEIIKAEHGLTGSGYVANTTPNDPKRFTIFPNGVDTNNHEVFTLNYQVWF